jgi:hypothetical protein
MEREEDWRWMMSSVEMTAREGARRECKRRSFDFVGFPGGGDDT